MVRFQRQRPASKEGDRNTILKQNMMEQLLGRILAFPSSPLLRCCARQKDHSQNFITATSFTTIGSFETSPTSS